MSKKRNRFMKITIPLILLLVIFIVHTKLKREVIIEVPGKNGDIEIKVEFDKSRIDNVEILRHNETKEVAEIAINNIPELIKKHQSINIESVSGATITSNSILDAVKQAIKKTGRKIEDYSKEKINMYNSSEDTVNNADVIIIGAGGAGLTAALSAAEQGATVIVIEKNSFIGGNTGIANGLYNTITEEESTEESIEKFYKDTFQGGREKAKPELVKVLVENAQSGVRWFKDLGVEFQSDRVTGLGGARSRGIMTVNKTGADYIKVLEKSCYKKGVDILTEVKAEELIVKDNKVVKVRATKGNKDIIFEANNGIVIATGGFANNVELRMIYNPLLTADILCSNIRTTTGDGIIMAEKINAKLIDMEYIQFYPTGDSETGALTNNTPLSIHNSILINKEGKRFVAEDQRRDLLTEEMLRQEGQFAYLLVDSDHLTKSEDIDYMEGLVDSGKSIKANSIKELAEKINIDYKILIDTIEQYNTSVEMGKDSFGREILQNKIDKAPFYITKRAPTIHHTMGGIEINENAEVISNDDQVIKNLYAAGEVTGGIHGANRLGGNSMTDLTVFGRIAGRNAAKNK